MSRPNAQGLVLWGREPTVVAAWFAAVAAMTRAAVAGHAEGIDTFRYINQARAILGDGSLSDERYPAGYPAMLALADLLGLPAWSVTTASGVLIVLGIWYLAMRLAGPWAGIAAGVLCLASTVIADSGVLIMSDTPAALFVLLALVAAVHERWALAGVFIAGSAWIRLPHAAFLAVSVRVRMAVACCAGLLLLATFNLIVFGALRTYQSNQAAWALDYINQALYLDNTDTPYGNASYYGAVLIGRWQHLVPLAALVAGLELWDRRCNRVAWFASGIIATNLTIYLFYFYQSARFVLPAAIVIVVYASAWVGRVAEEAIASRTRSPSLDRTPA